MIDLATAKAHLRVETDDEDALIGAYLAAAQGAIETTTSKLFVPASVTQVLDGFPRRDGPVRLFQGPVSATGLSVAYDDQDGNPQTLADFRLVEGPVARLLPAYGACWPPAHCGEGSVRVTYTAGYADGEIPPELDTAVLLLTGHYYANREAVIADNRAAAVELPLGIEMLIANYTAPGIA